MTNEELIDGQMCQCCSQRRECVHDTRNRCAEYEDAIELLKEKDQQFKGYLLNVVKTYKCRDEAYFFKEIAAIEIIINELFKEENEKL